MFVRPCWRPLPEESYRLIDDHSWALLITNGEDGPLATNLPLLLDRDRGPKGTLVGHIARANEHAAALVSAPGPVLAVFEGPYSYVTPSWYPNRDMPGTYYYTAVHCYGRVRKQSEEELVAGLRTLNERMEGPIPGGWKMEEVPWSEIARRLPSIVGFEIEIERLEGKFKLGQDEPKKDALAVAARLLASSEQAQRALGEMVRSANDKRDEL